MTGHDEYEDEFDEEIHNDDGDSTEDVDAVETNSDGGFEQSDALRTFLRNSKPHRSAPPATTASKPRVR